MEKKGFFYRWMELYVDGFRNMSLGRTLWGIILIKLFVIFVVLKWLFFPDFLGKHAPDGRQPDYVSEQLIERAE